MVQNKGTSPQEIVGAKYQFKASLVQGNDKINWSYYDSGMQQLLADVSWEQCIGKLSNLSSFINNEKDFDLQVSVKILRIKLMENHLKPVDIMPSKMVVLDHLKNMLETGENSDVTIFLGQEQYKLHKNILSARSEVFAKIFKESPEITEFDINGRVNKESIDAFLKFIYTAEWKIHSVANAMIVMTLANRFKVHDLKEIFEQMLLSYVARSNAMDMLQFAVHNDSEFGLKQAAFYAVKE